MERCDEVNLEPPGLTLFDEVITQAEEAALIGLIVASGLSYCAYDPDNRRSSKSYGWKYDFLKDSFVPCDPLPEGLRAIAKNAAKNGRSNYRHARVPAR
jgi:hypothetical protein